MQKLTNQFIQHGSLWGNLYRMRYYVDGKRTTKSEFDRAYRSAGLTAEQANSEKGPGWYRLTWVG